MNKRNIIIGVVVFWISVVLSFVGYMEYIKSQGEIVIVKVIPVDPRDFFRGDYVILSFPFSRPSDDKNIDKTKLYVTYTKGNDNRLIEVTGFIDKMPLNGQAIKGNYTNDNWSRMEFGIEQYYVPEEKGHDLENAIRTKKVEAEIAIDKFGRSIIKNILVDGIVWKP